MNLLAFLGAIAASVLAVWGIWELAAWVLRRIGGRKG